MSTLVACCCEEGIPYYILRPCYWQTVGSLKYMTGANWSSCGFNTLFVYKNGYCGYWTPATAADIVGQTLDATCANYALQPSCCGGPFDPCPDVLGCCGYKKCLEYHNAQGNGVPLDIKGYTATSGSAGSSWTASVSTLSVSAPVYYNGTYADFRYKVSGTIEVNYIADPSGTIDCDGNARPPSPTFLPFEFWVQHVENIGCPLTAVANSYSDICDITTPVCPGTTTTTGTGFSACDYLIAETSGSPTMLSGVPQFNRDCNPPLTSYSVRVPMKVTMSQNIGNPDNCVPGCTSSIWHARYFPDTSATFNITLSGVWRF